MVLLSGWGRYPVLKSQLRTPEVKHDVRRAMQERDGFVARGSGLSYGDASIGANSTISMTKINRIISFDRQLGVVRVEAGLLISDLLDTFYPSGGFLRAVPGTRFVSVGGAIAADVHGKNHHGSGGFGSLVVSLLLMTSDGELIEVSRESNVALFRATIGGMGLTGIILEATIKIQSIETGWIKKQTVIADDLASAIAVLDKTDGFQYSVAWIDCLARGRGFGRALIYTGEHASEGDLAEYGKDVRYPPFAAPTMSIPFDLPSVLLNGHSISAFNKAYHYLAARHRTPTLVTASSYFFPLDKIRNWNRIYGRVGFLQHQCVLPNATAHDALAQILDKVGRRGAGSFLAILKKTGSGEGLMSFPMPGYTLSMDFPLRSDLLAFLSELDEVVCASGGRIYLAKDAMQSRETFEAGYPNLAAFRAARGLVDPKRRILSHLASRLAI